MDRPTLISDATAASAVGETVSTQATGLSETVGTGSRRSPRRGKVVNVGGVRSVKYYQWTIHELGMLGTRRASALRSFSIAAFCGGLMVDSIKDLALNPPTDPMAKGVWATLIVIASAVGVYNLAVGLKRSRGADDFQKDIVDEHDFD